MIAYKWYKKAADKGHPIAMYNLARLYKEKHVYDKEGKSLIGFTCNKYVKKMRKLFLMSAEQGYHLAIEWREDDCLLHSITSNHIFEFIRELSNFTKKEKDEFFKSNQPLDSEEINDVDEDINK